jgi:hypothetical protein
MNHLNKRINEMWSRLQLLEMATESLQRRVPALHAEAERVERNRQRVELGLEPIYS